MSFHYEYVAQGRVKALEIIERKLEDQWFPDIVVELIIFSLNGLDSSNENAVISVKAFGHIADQSSAQATTVNLEIKPLVLSE